MPRFATRLDSIPPSPTLAVSSTAKQLKADGHDVVSFASGEPDFNPPAPIVEAAAAAIAAGHNGYIATSGLPALREAIAADYGKRGREVKASEVVVTVGGKQALYNATQVLFQEGDRVLIPAPYWVSYPEMVSLAGATPVFLESGADLKVAPEDLRRALAADPTIRGFILCAPSNPTGVVYSSAELSALGKVLEEFPEVWIYFDAIYDQLSYVTPLAPDFLANAPSLAARTITFNGFSKAYAMTGWRLGYAIAPEEVIRRMTILQSQSTSNAVTFVQHAALAALALGEAEMAAQRELYRGRRDAMCGALDALEGVTYVRPDGAFYVFADFRSVIGPEGPFKTCEQFSTELLNEKYVATTHGAAFGAPGFVRLTYTRSVERIEEGVSRIASFVKSRS